MKGVISFILIYIILCAQVFGAKCDPTREDCPPPPPPFDPAKDKLIPDSYQEGKNYPAIFDNPNFDNSLVPSEHVGEIPPSKLDVNRVKFQNRLTYDQLAYGGYKNYNDVADKDKLDPVVRDKIASEISKKDVKTKTSGPTSGTATDTGFTFSRLEQLDVGKEISIRDGEGIEVDPPTVKIEKANVVEFMGTFNEKVENFEANTDKGIYHVEKANRVHMACFGAMDVRDSTFTLNKDLHMKTNGSVTIKSGFGKEFTYSGADENNSLTTDPKECDTASFTVNNAD